MKLHSEDRLMNVSDPSKFLSVAPSTIYRWLERGLLPQPFEIGEKAVRWRKSEIIKWLEDKRR